MKRMRVVAAVLMGGMLSLPAFARSWQVDAAHSALAFTGTYQGEKFQGRFKSFAAKIDYDPANLAQAKFDVTIDTGSMDTANTERDQALPGKDFFDTTQFPRAHFVTTRFRGSAGGAVLADGTLTLRGVTKPVTLAVQFTQTGNAATLDVATALKRLDFGIGIGDWSDTSMIGNEVAVHGHLVLLP